MAETSGFIVAFRFSANGDSVSAASVRVRGNGREILCAHAIQNCSCVVVVQFLMLSCGDGPFVVLQSHKVRFFRKWYSQFRGIPLRVASTRAFSILPSGMPDAQGRRAKGKRSNPSMLPWRKPRGKGTTKESNLMCTKQPFREPEVESSVAVEERGALMIEEEFITIYARMCDQACKATPGCRGSCKVNGDAYGNHTGPHTCGTCGQSWNN